MDVVLKCKNGGTLTINTDEFMVESISIKDSSFKREDFEIVQGVVTYKITLVSNGFMELDDE